MLFYQKTLLSQCLPKDFHFRHQRMNGQFVPMATRIELARHALKIINKTLSYPAMSAQLDVSPEWLIKFASGEIQEPGALKFEELELWLEQWSGDKRRKR